MAKYTDGELIKMIQSGDAALWNKAVDHLYSVNGFQTRKQIIAYIKKHGGNTEDGQDMCHDAFIVAERKIREGSFNGGCKIDSFIVATAKWLWWNKQRKKKPILGIDLELSAMVEQSVETYLLLKERKELLEQAIQSLPERCRDLMAMTAKGYSNTEISEALNHQDKKQTENKLTRCKKVLREILQRVKL